MIYTMTLNPAVDRTCVINHFALGQVNRAESCRIAPGGKGVNVSRAIKRLGGESMALGIVGGDTGAFIRRVLAEESIVHQFHDSAVSTRLNDKVVDLEYHTTTDINVPGAPIEEEIWQRALQDGLQRPQQGDIMVVCGSLPPQCDVRQVGDWLGLLSQKGVRVFLDAADELLAAGIQAKPELIKPNVGEFARYVGRPLVSTQDIIDQAQRVIQAGVRNIVITMGERGALFIDKQKAYYADAVPVAVYSTVGAGDVLMAALALYEQRCRHVEDIIRFTMAAGAAAVMQGEMGALTPQNVERLMQQVRFERVEISPPEAELQM